MYAPRIIREMQAELLKKLSAITKEGSDTGDVALIKLGSSNRYTEISKKYDAQEFSFAPGDFIFDSNEDDLLIFVGVRENYQYFLRTYDTGGVSLIDYASREDFICNGYILVTEDKLLKYEEDEKADVIQITEVLIKVDKDLINVLMKKFDVTKFFVELSLNLSADEVPELEEVSEAQTTKEAEAEHLEAENCCDDKERAAFRRWLRLTDSEEEILKIYERVSCEDGDFEKKLAIKKMAIVLRK